MRHRACIGAGIAQFRDVDVRIVADHERETRRVYRCQECRQDKEDDERDEARAADRRHGQDFPWKARMRTPDSMALPAPADARDQ
jgi:hypothetical protein